MDKPAREIAWVRRRMQRLGCVEYARAVAHALAGAALHEFQVAFAPAPDSKDKQFIEALPYWVLERS
jgi:geranylgeranyl diphosphate synthase type II